MFSTYFLAQYAVQRDLDALVENRRNIVKTKKQEICRFSPKFALPNTLRNSGFYCYFWLILVHFSSILKFRCGKTMVTYYF